MLGVDNEMVVPVNKVIRIQTTGDVIHSFAVPAFGIKIDSIPGRLNEGRFRPPSSGMFYGQCSELRQDHAFMRCGTGGERSGIRDLGRRAKKKFATAPANSFASAGATAQ